MLHRNTIGVFRYLSFTRPNISFIMNSICQFSHSPTVNHLETCKRVLRYFKSFFHLGVILTANNRLQVQSLVNADWASNWMIDDLRVVIIFILAKIWFRGAIKGSMQLSNLVQRLNIELWLT